MLIDCAHCVSILILSDLLIYTCLVFLLSGQLYIFVYLVDTIIGPSYLIEMDFMLAFNNMFELFHSIVRISIFMLA